MTGSCREQFRHFVLMSEVSSAVVSCKLPLNYAHSFLFLLSPSLLSSSIFISHCLVPLNIDLLFCHPSFRPAISRSDPLVGNYCIFNPDLDNGTVTVIFAPGLFAALRPFVSLTLCIPLLPIIVTLTNSEQCYNRNYVYVTPYLQL